MRNGKVDLTNERGVQQMLSLLKGAALPPVEQTAKDPFVGLTTDGVPLRGLFSLADEGFESRSAAAAAMVYLDQLSDTERGRAVSTIDSPDWQLWINAFLTFPEHGLCLQDLDENKRAAALGVIRACLSSLGYHRVRDAMRLNGELGEFLGAYLDTLTEFTYWFTVFGDPSTDGPWGWQLAGHHVDVHCFIVGKQVVLTPTFLGTEFRGEEVFQEHRVKALEFMNSLSSRQRESAVLFRSLLPPELPAELAGPVDGRHRAGAGQDNLVLPYEGLRSDLLSAGQKELLLALVGPFIDLLTDGPLVARRAQIADHMDDSWFTWIGDSQSDSPFYFKVHSPVVLVEYDNHPGIFLDNDQPQPFHVHTIVRTPNRGDYGKDLLAQHYAQHHH
ncbi:DUF3500 domain-containing protein [Mycolicibacterium sp. YH-1]|uniref:DUF3500 domain-containing protein n=1 Tax=Mycolicibacterium sp. YH-1 TaxID=2908837 RepID=UPI001F4BD4BA|nr:DUF3500 domain-containing protein [Mycolicibacterium sp. YH-1]UNB54547.1 DUF3500 domain-containing protein [Mycolicibacterium sp. YH-1]